MKILVYKPCLPVYWDNMSKDFNVWSREIVGFSKMMADKGHEVYLGMKTDYNNTYKNVFRLSLTDLKNDEVDMIVVFNGDFENNEDITEKYILSLVPNAKKVLIASDLDLAVKKHDFDLYNVVLTAGPLPLKNSITPQRYAAVEHYHMYGEEIGMIPGWEFRKNEGIFVGMSRHKEEKFLEYVWRPSMHYFGISSVLNINKVIGRDEAYDVLKRYTYSIVFFDKRVEDLGFVTARPLELIKFGVIPFIDEKYDSHKIQFSEEFDYLRVKNYEEFYNKSQDMCKERYNAWVDKLNSWFKKHIASGEVAYKLFMGCVENE